MTAYSFVVPGEVPVSFAEHTCGGFGTYDTGSVEGSCRSAARHDSPVSAVPPFPGQSEYASVKTLANPTCASAGMKNDKVTSDFPGFIIDLIEAVPRLFWFESNKLSVNSTGIFSSDEIETLTNPF